MQVEESYLFLSYIISIIHCNVGLDAVREISSMDDFVIIIKMKNGWSRI